MAQPVRVFHIVGDKFTELEAPPEKMPATGYLWIAAARPSFEEHTAAVQAALLRLTGTPLFDLHVVDLLNKQLPSSFDYTSAYDLLVFTRLGANALAEPAAGEAPKTHSHSNAARIDTSPVGFAVYDRVLLSVHPSDCAVRDFFAQRLETRTAAPATSGDGRSQSRMPTSPADLMLRMVNYMVDSYLELRRVLTKQLDDLQAELFGGKGAHSSWHALLDSRNTLHLLEDICEDQRAAVVEWLDALEEWPETTDAAVQKEREQLRVRSRDVLEHIERVLTHVRRLESSSETAVQIHFSQQSNRTNDIMRGLTVLTAIFLPLNLVTGFFGMNFEGLPLIHSAKGFWIVFTVMLALGVGSSYFFWRKRYLGTP